MREFNIGDRVKVVHPSVGSRGARGFVIEKSRFGRVFMVELDGEGHASVTRWWGSAWLRAISPIERLAEASDD